MVTRSPTRSTLGFVLCLLLVSVVCEAAFQSNRQTLRKNLQQKSSQQTQTQLNAFPNAFRVKSKKRGKVVLDPATGFYRPEKVADVKNQPTNANVDRPRRWDGFKSAVYGTVDGIRTFNLPKKIRIITTKVVQNTGKDMSGVSDQDKDLVVGGYADRAKTVTKTPKERMNLYQNMNVDVFVPERSSKDEPTPAVSVFDSVKGAFYATVDTVEATSSSNNKNISNKKETPAMKTFKPLVQSSRGMTMSKDVRQAFIDRGSENPVKRAAADLMILQWEVKYYENVQEPNETEKEHAAVLKESIFKLGDALEESIDAFPELFNKVMAFPQDLSKFVEKLVHFFASIPDKSQKAFDTVTSIPARLQEKQAEAEKALQNSIAQTNQLVADVKAIPDNVQKTVQETKKSIDDTVDSVQELTTKTKVLLRLEAPIPKPPRIPPPDLAPEPLTASQIGMKVAGGLVTGTAKAVWWVGKGAATFGFAQVQKAIISLRSVPPSETVERPVKTPNGEGAVVAHGATNGAAPVVEPVVAHADAEKRSVETSASTDKKDPVLKQPEPAMKKEESPTPKTPTTVAKAPAAAAAAAAAAVPTPELSDLDRQVADALLLAKFALESVSERESASKQD